MKNSIPAGVKFIHLRRYKNWWESGGADDYDIYEPRGGTTIAYKKDVFADLVKVGVAKCSEKDHYNKKIGRQVAMGRLEHQWMTVEINQKDPLVSQIISQVL